MLMDPEISDGSGRLGGVYRDTGRPMQKVIGTHFGSFAL